MRTIIRIMKSELRVLFFSPIAWLILIVFGFQVGMEFSENIYNKLLGQELGYRTISATASIFTGYGGLLPKILKELYLYIPLFTMGLMSRELSSGSIKLLYSSPVSNFQIVTGKYLSALVYGLLLCVILLFPVLFTSISIVEPDIPLMLTGILGVFLTIAAYSAIGLFMSTITKYQVVAVVGTLVVLAMLNFIGEVGQEYDFVRDITYWLSIAGRSRVFIDGMICTKDVLYFLLVIFLFLSMTIIKLQGERLKLPKMKTATQYGVVVLFVLSLGYVSSRPTFIKYLDVTNPKSNTLTLESQEIVEKLKGDLTITTYINYLDESYDRGAPRNRIIDMNEFDQFIRFKPEIKLNYVYYYAEGVQSYPMPEYDTMTVRQQLEHKCRYSGHNPNNFLSLEDVLKYDDIKDENGRFSRVITSSNGKKAFLRIYKDNDVYPHEAQISTALKTLITDAPSVGFVIGHKERGCKDYGEKGYGSFADNKTFRYSLINGGFGVREISLEQPVPEDINIIVLADMRSDFTEQEHINFDAYLARGGNMFILGEPKRQCFMNPVISKLGLRFANGVIVAPSDINLDDIIGATFVDNASSISPQFEYLAKRGYTIVTPSATSVEAISSDSGFNMTPVLASRPQKSWLEKETTDFLNEKSVLNSDIGEKEKANVVMMYLNRNVNDKEQRIFVIGDADCISTLELSTERVGFGRRNFTLISEVFRNLSYGEFPVDASRDYPPDNKITTTQKGIMWMKIFSMWIIPISLLIGCLSLLILRRRR